ncbi:MAG TPA: SGNH/GDSL hydrolase family protein [Sphingomicrobium sp.]
MRQRSNLSKSSVFAVAALLFGLGSSPASPAQRSSKWVSSWAAAEIAIDPKDALPSGNDLTLRQLVQVTTGGVRVRVRISNAFGSSPLEISGVHIARATAPSSSRIDVSSDKAVMFGGAVAVSIPAGAEYLSDPVTLNAPAFTTLAVSIHFPRLSQHQTGHPGSRATSYSAPGNQLSEVVLRDAATMDRWYYLSGVDVQPEIPSAAIAIVGDSIVDGHGVVSNTNTRWTDYLAKRLKGGMAVLNLGIGSNCLAQNCVGPNTPSRLGRDVFARNGVRYLIILEGVNDLGLLTRDAPVSAEAHHALVEQMIGALAQVSERAHERGIKVIGATIMPYGASGYYHPDAANDADREAVNAWIRAPGHVDAVVDFDALMRDPAHPQRLKKQFDSGDGLHPSPEGYRFMAAVVPLSLFTKSVTSRRKR